MALTVSEVAGLFANARQQGKGWKVTCPAHQDDKASLIISAGDDGRVLLHCHAGCSFDSVVEAAKIKPADLFPPSNRSKAKAKIVATYPYCNEAGEVLFEAVRFDPKDFKQRRPDGKGDWKWSVKGVRVVPFRLPNLLKEPNAGVVVAEGEKDVLNLARIGILATCNAGGAEKWYAEHAQFLRGRRVAIICDNDDAGRRHAEQVARSLIGIAASVRIVYLPNLPPKGDVSDWLAAGGTREDLIRLLNEAPEITAESLAASTTAAKQDERLKLPAITLPGEFMPIITAAEKLGELLAETGGFFLRGGVPMRAAKTDGEIALAVVEPAAASSDFERVARLQKTKTTKEGPISIPHICPEPLAKQIIKSQAFKTKLPPITVLSHCPVIVEKNGQLEVITGYDLTTGIWAMGDPPPDMSLDEAKAMLDTLIRDFDFASPHDRSRAIAAFLTPAMVFGGLLGGRAPIDLSEADDSQAGKGFRAKLVTAIYRAEPKAVTQREKGVGSTQENFDRALIGGHCFVSFDNVRGRLSMPALESFMTESSYMARVAYVTTMEIDPRKFIILLTSNRAELEKDLANRSSATRIRKHADNYEYQVFPEGNLLDHVLANQPRYLGAVFAIIREWHRRGKPRLENVPHDFKQWGCSLGWIVEHLLGEAPLLADHRKIQKRMSSTAGNWLRDLSLAIKASGHLNEWLRASHLLPIILARGVVTPGISEELNLDDENVFKQATAAIGRKLRCAVPPDQLVDADGGIFAEVRSEVDERGRDRRAYRFVDVNEPEIDKSTRGSPGIIPEIPDAQDSRTYIYTHAPTHTHIRSSDTSRDSGNIGFLPGEPLEQGENEANWLCDHSNSSQWRVEGGKAYCRGCGEFMEYVMEDAF